MSREVTDDNAADREQLVSMLAEMSIAELENFCRSNSTIVNQNELWRALFEKAFPEIYQIAKHYSFPDLETRLESSERVFLPWRDLYYDFMYLCSKKKLRMKLEEILNTGEVKNDDSSEEISKAYFLPNYILGQVNPHWCRYLIIQHNPIMLSIIKEKDGYIEIFLRDAVRAGFTALVERILDQQRDQFIHSYGTYCNRAIEAGHIDIVALFMKEITYNEIVLSELLLTAVKYHRTAIVNLFLRDERFDTRVGDFAVHHCAANKGYADIVSLLLSHPCAPLEVYGHALRYAVEKKHLNVVQVILADKRINIASQVKSMLFGACQENSEEIILLFLEDLRVSHTDLPSWAFWRFTEDTFVKIVGIVLADESLDIADKLQGLLEDAIRKNYRNAVQILLADARVNPTINDNNAIKTAAQKGHTQIVQDLLAWQQNGLSVDPSADYDHAIKVASRNGHTVIVRILLADPRVDPGAYYDCAFVRAVEKGHMEVVHLLLADPRVDPATRRCRAVVLAAKKGHQEIFDLLLSDPRIKEYLSSEKIEKLSRLCVTQSNIRNAKLSS